MAQVVLVHGNPETTAIWDPLLAALGRDDVETLSPPGFGAPVPEGFGATTDDYVAWLVGELQPKGAPVDLVGHDWGGGHVMRVAIERPDLIRSWVIDIAGCFAPDYVWHESAQAWQTPNVGEDAVARMMSTPEEIASAVGSRGMSADIARRVVAAFNDDMGRCILALYRSAAQPMMARVGDQLTSAAARPGLVIIPTADDATGGESRARWAAERAGAEVAVLPGLGHWWMIQDPIAGATALRTFWSSID
jgi:pimeloyl-ACP methyl ester carboxylesterase